MLKRYFSGSAVIKWNISVSKEIRFHITNAEVQIYFLDNSREKFDGKSLFFSFSKEKFQDKFKTFFFEEEKIIVLEKNGNQISFLDDDNGSFFIIIKKEESVKICFPEKIVEEFCQVFSLEKESMIKKLKKGDINEFFYSLLN